MPPVAIAAGIAAGGSIIGGAISSSSQKKAVKAQQSAAQAQIAEAQRNQQYLTGLSQPTIDRGNAAGELIGNFLGTGNNRQSAADALATFRGSTGYQDMLNTGLGAVNANAYSRGLGASGATLKALQARGSAIADQSAQGWLGNLQGLSSQGQQAINTIGGVATNTTNTINAANGNAADAASNGALANGANWNSVLQNLANVGGAFAGAQGSGMASSYAGLDTRILGQGGGYSYNPRGTPFIPLGGGGGY